MSLKNKTGKNAAPLNARTAQTRKAMCNGLLSLLEEKPFEQTIVREITARAGVGYATFFRHYDDKDALLNDLASQEIHKLLSMTLPILYSTDSLASAQALCSFVGERKKFWKTLLTGGASAIVKEEYLNQALELARNKSHPDAWLPDDLAVSFTVAAAIETLVWWLKQENPPPAQQVAIYLNQLAIKPVLNPPVASSSTNRDS